MEVTEADLLTERHLNRALLARQMLLERSQLPVPRTLERMAGLQAQYAPSMYLGLWTRLEGLHREDVTRGLERRTVAQGTLLRSTIHLVSAADYWPFALAVRAARRSWWLATHRTTTSADGMAAVAARLRDQLHTNGAVSRKELEAIIGKGALEGIGLWLDLVRVPPSGTWARRRADRYAAADDWLGPPPPDLDVDQATDHLVRRYLAGFGPASVGEIASWSGLKPAVVTASMARLPARTFRAENGDALLDLPRAPRPNPDTPAPVRFLAVWDAMMLVHARRKGVVAEEHRPRIFTSKNPQSCHTFLVDGTVAGSWRHEGGRIELEPFVPLTSRARKQIADEAERLAAFFAES
jgi:Winged helix DNA-binding domain